MDYSKLKAKLLEPDIMALNNDTEILDVLTLKVQVKKPILTHDIQEYLMLTDDLELIEAGTSVACKRAARALELFTEFNIAHEIKGVMIEAKLNQILDDIVSDASLAFTETDKTNILSMGIEEKSWAEQNGYNPLRIGYLAKARVL